MKVRIPSVALAKAWQAVAIASGDDANTLVLFKTVLLEHFPDRGIRLVATDSYLFLRAWVAFDESDEEAAEQPGLDELPDESYVVTDPDGRGLGLLKYVRKVWDKDDQAQHAPPLELETRVEKSAQIQLAGMELPVLHLTYEDHESIQMRLLEADYPSWRQLTLAKDKATKVISLNPELLNRLGGLGRLYPYNGLHMTFSGHNHAAKFNIGPIDGLIMPMASAAS